MQKSFVRGTWQQKRAFSPCVIAQGAGRTIYIAGHTGQTDDSGKSLAGDFDAQFHQTFRNIEKTLAEAGAKLSDMVTMTVFLIDARYTTAHDRAAQRAVRQGFSGECRDHGPRLRPAGDDDRGARHRGHCVSFRPGSGEQKTGFYSLGARTKLCRGEPLLAEARCPTRLKPR